MTEMQIIAAMDAELERLFDARIGAASASGALQLLTRKGRRLKVSQGAGDGSLFGTDEANSGGLLARETMRNNMTALNGKAIIFRLQTPLVVKFLSLIIQLNQILRFYLT